jgi:formin-binding protein 1
VIEKEYAGKLNALAKKYFEKKAKKSSSLSVGETPTVTPGSLERSELPHAKFSPALWLTVLSSASMTTWGVQLTTLESRAAEHDRLSSQLLSNLAEPLKNIAVRYEEMRKTHAEFAVKLEREREGAYSDLRRVKGKYDGACQEVESKRKKTDNSQKAQNVYHQQLAEMQSVKVEPTYHIIYIRLTVSEYISHLLKRHKQAKREILPRIRPRTDKCTVPCQLG